MIVVGNWLLSAWKNWSNINHTFIAIARSLSVCLNPALLVHVLDWSVTKAVIGSIADVFCWNRKRIRFKNQWQKNNFFLLINFIEFWGNFKWFAIQRCRKCLAQNNGQKMFFVLSQTNRHAKTSAINEYCVCLGVQNACFTSFVYFDVYFFLLLRRTNRRRHRWARQRERVLSFLCYTIFLLLATVCNCIRLLLELLAATCVELKLYST